MIDLDYWPAPNGWKISIMLEECSMPLSVFESGAILQCLAENAGNFLPKDLRGKYVYAPQFNPAEPLAYGQQRYSDEVNRLSC